jgi:hypothetical protein
MTEGGKLVEITPGNDWCRPLEITSGADKHGIHGSLEEMEEREGTH